MLVKFCLGDDCRRVKFNLDQEQVLSLEELMQKSTELFGLVEPFQLKYKDIEGDLITLTRQSDLEDILSSDYDSSRSFKLYLYSKLSPPPPEYLPNPSMEVRPTNITRSRFESSYDDREMLEILRDISIYICSRDLTPPGIRSWVSSQKNLVTPENAYGFDSRPIYPRVTRTKANESPMDRKILGLLNRRVQSWGTDQVSQWLSRFGFEDLVPLFQAHDITGELLLDLDHNSLKELGVASAGRRLKLLKRIGQIHQALAPRSPDQGMETHSNPTTPL